MTIVAPVEIGISCFNIDEMIKFYSSAFSFDLINEISVPANASKGLIFCDAGYRVARLQAPFGERIKLLSPNGPHPGTGKPRKAINILREPHTVFITLIVNDIEAVLNLAITLGATAMGSAVRIRPDLCIAFMQDPEENYIELAQYDNIHLYRPDLPILRPTPQYYAPIERSARLSPVQPPVDQK